MNKKSYTVRAFAVAMLTALIIVVSACAASDVVARFAKSSFASVLDASAGRVAWSEPDFAWRIASAEGDAVLFSSDFSLKAQTGGVSETVNPDVSFVFDAAPFIAAGLDVSALPPAEGITYALQDGVFTYRFELGSDVFGADAKKSAGSTFAEIVRTQRDRIGYHEKLDHYGIKLGNGNMFEWAKDTAKNDKDIVFVLNPAPFIAAGVDPAKIQGWIFAKVEMKDDAGKTIYEDKLLRPFNLK